MGKKLVAGEYYIGDPCYAISQEEWGDFVAEIVAKEKNENSKNGFTINFHGHEVFVVTVDGDGDYYDQKKKNYGVDSGTIGAIPKSMCIGEDLDFVLESGQAHIHTFDTDFECVVRHTKKGNPRVQIGNITIK